MYPVVHVTSKPQRMTDSDISDLVHFLERCLSAGRPCGFLHDLRHISTVSSRQQVRRFRDIHDSLRRETPQYAFRR